jgi:hypothetical protein
VYCNKVFKTEAFLEKHFENRHVGTIKSSGSCLAEYCDLLECDLLADFGGDMHVGHSTHCSAKQMQRRRHRCHAVLDACFPPHLSAASNTLHHKCACGPQHAPARARGALRRAALTRCGAATVPSGPQVRATLLRPPRVRGGPGGDRVGGAHAAPAARGGGGAAARRRGGQDLGVEQARDGAPPWRRAAPRSRTRPVAAAGDARRVAPAIVRRFSACCLCSCS